MMTMETRLEQHTCSPALEQPGLSRQNSSPMMVQQRTGLAVVFPLMEIPPLSAHGLIMTMETVLVLHMCSPALEQPGPNRRNFSHQTAKQGTILVMFLFLVIPPSLEQRLMMTTESIPGQRTYIIRTGTTWTQQAKLLASDGQAGDQFSRWAVSLDDDTALIGAEGDDDNGVDSGSTYVFTRTGTTWTQQAKLLAGDGATNDYFGNSVSLSGDTALIGAENDDDNGDNSGSAYMFTRTGTTWTQQQKLLASDGAAGDLFGYPVLLSGDTALITAVYDDDMGTNSGSVYEFTKSGTDLTFSITGGLGVNLKITNNGLINATDVAWQIHVEGGILGRINKTVNGTVDIPAGLGMTVSVGTGMLFGFGPITITVKVADEEQTATGIQFIIFSMVKK